MLYYIICLRAGPCCTAYVSVCSGPQQETYILVYSMLGVTPTAYERSLANLCLCTGFFWTLAMVRVDLLGVHTALSTW
jgi:hypothetical protein